MAKKPTITTIASGFQSTTQLNANLNAINNALDNTLSLDGSTPNAMTADIDLNSNDLLNVAATHTTQLYLGGTRVVVEGTLNTVSNMDVDEFTGNGSTVAYTLSSTPLSVDVVIVNVNGVAQLATSYTLSVATVTFSAAPALNSNIQIRYFTDIQLGSTTSADLVSYSQGGTSHVNRTVESRLRDHVSVMDFGAVGDGVTDDTAAFNAAWSATNPKAVLVPAASYKITGTVTGKFFSFGAATVVGGPVTTITNLATITDAGMFPRLHMHAVAAPQGFNMIGSRVLDRGDGRTTFIVRKSRVHAANNDSSIWAFDSRDDGQTKENLRQLYYDTSTFSADLFIADIFNGKGVILSSVRNDNSGTITYQAPVIIQSATPDVGDWTATSLTLDAALPANFGANWIGAFYPWPASEGGHDTDGWVAYAYSQTAIAYITTDDNWATYSTVTRAIAPMGQSLTEVGVMGTHASGYTMLLRVNGAVKLWMSFATNLVGPWSTPVVSTLDADDSPPSLVTISSTEAYLYIRSGKNVQGYPDYQGHLLVRPMNPTLFKSSVGVSGYGVVSPFLNLGSWPADYPHFFKRGNEWCMITSGGEQVLYPNTTQGGESQLMFVSQTPAASLSIHTARSLMLRPEDNALPNGDFQVWRETTGTPTSYETAAYCWRVGKTSGGTGHEWSRQNGADMQYALRFGRTAGQTFTYTLNCVTAIRTVDVYSLRGRNVTFGVDVLKGANLSGQVFAYVAYANAITPMDTTDGSYTGMTALFTVSNPTLTSTSNTRLGGSFFLPADAQMLSIRIVFNPTGTAGANDWLQIENAFVVEGNYAPLWTQPRKYSDAKRAVRRYRSETWPSTTPQTLQGAYYMRASHATTYITVPFPDMNGKYTGDPIGTAYSPVTGAAGKAADITAVADVTATVISEGLHAGTVEMTGCTVGNTYAVHVEMDAEMW
tara:strand:- start:569 stop:3388 length:2820 start_codon:yes stop_codon:yes gene_type:complete